MNSNHQSVNQTEHNGYNTRQPVRNDRTVGMYILLYLLTCGIYGLFFIIHWPRMLIRFAKKMEATPQKWVLTYYFP